MTAADNKAVLRRYGEEVWNKGNLALFDELIAPNLVLRFPGVPETRDDFRAFVPQFRAAFPDLQLTIADLVAEGDLVAVHWTMRGTQRGVFQGIAPTGKAVTMTMTVFYRLRDGQIEQAWGDWDLLGVQQQLGAGAK
ncbi:MAG: ester cyclase [Candidatus Binatia bacterium]